jgi:hypothetical protein
VFKVPAWAAFIAAVIAIIVYFVFIAGCVRKGQPGYSNKESYHVKCWSAGEPILEENSRRAFFASSGELYIDTDQGRTVVKADCLVTPLN